MHASEQSSSSKQVAPLIASKTEPLDFDALFTQSIVGSCLLQPNDIKPKKNIVYSSDDESDELAYIRKEFIDPLRNQIKHDLQKRS
jgi:hypothetical protein